MKICKVCLTPLKDVNFRTFFHQENILCRKCLNNFKPQFSKEKINGLKVKSIYYYDETIRSLLYQFKGAGDYELYPVFLKRFARYLRLKYRNYTLIPAPSVKKDDERRGFNHVEAIFSVLELPIVKAIKKIGEGKQSSRSYEERKLIKNELVVDENVILSGKKILLVDDVLTTGSTLKSILSLIEPLKPACIEILVLSIVKSKQA